MDTVEGWASYMTVSGSTWIAIMGLTGRGFTGHQHVDRLDLIHMNGRTYDPKVGRFMQADVFVPHPGDTQSYNRYSYVRNNPLNATDPTGYFDLKDGLKMVGAAVAAYYTFGWAYGAFEAAAGSCFAAGSGAAIGAGAASGAAAGFVSGGIMGGNMEGALQGAFSGAVFGGIGGMFNTATLGGHVMSGATQAVAGGGISVMQGGKFGHGFVSAGVTAVAMPAVNTQRGLVRVAAAAVVGGTASVASGGKFANGAMTAAFQAAVTSGAQSSSAGKSSGAASTIGGILGKIWNLPNTLIGMAYGGVGHVIGEVGNVLGFYSAEPTISFGHNAIQFENNPLMATAMTFGNTIVYGKGSDYQPNVRWVGHAGTLGQEEMQHTFQGQILGPLYFPAHALFGAAAMISSGGFSLEAWHENANLLERGPHDKIDPRSWP
ncbi:MAG: RHS repeat-associated core domain-containing protein [Gammaproteobacteria bacterium]|nr:RHS repeat-associated core domain-containing protein [Gammaproteobacteria bacterium]